MSQKFKTIYADPPWEERGGGKIVRGAQRHYPLMKSKDIIALPVQQFAEDDCHLYLWVTNGFLPVGLVVMKAWGFRYITCVTWGKVNEKGDVQTGIGQYFRGASEQLLFGVRGRIPYSRDPVTGKRIQGKTLVLAPREEHSVKPECFRKIIEKVSPGPYLELFRRGPTPPGWSCWGNEADNAIQLW